MSGKPNATQPTGRSRCTWEDAVKAHLIEIGRDGTIMDGKLEQGRAA